MEEVKKASVITKLTLGRVEAAVGLYKVTGDAPKKREWESASPGGKRLCRTAEEAKEGPDQELMDALSGEAPKKRRSGRGSAARPARVLYERGTAKEVTPEEIRKGIFLDDRFVDLTDHLQKIEEDSKLERLEVVAFIDSRHVPRERILGSYYVGRAEGEGFPPGIVLTRLYLALKDRGRAAVVRWTKRKGHSLGLMVPYQRGGLLILEMAWAEQVRKPNAQCLLPLGAQVSVPPEELEAFGTLVDSLAGRRDSLDDLRDARLVAEQELGARAESGELDTETAPLFAEPRPEEMDRLAEMIEEAAAEAAKV